jgi:hypothetical protein
VFNGGAYHEEIVVILLGRLGQRGFHSQAIQSGTIQS